MPNVAEREREERGDEDGEERENERVAGEGVGGTLAVPRVEGRYCR